MPAFLHRVGRAIEHRLDNPRPGGFLQQLRKWRRAQLRRRAARAARRPPSYETLMRPLNLMALRSPQSPRRSSGSSSNHSDLMRWLSPTDRQAEADELGLLETQRIKFHRAKQRRRNHYAERRQRRMAMIYDHDIASEYLPDNLEELWRQDEGRRLDYGAISEEYLGPRDENGRIPVFRRDYMEWLEDLFRWPDGTVQTLFASDAKMCRLAQEALVAAVGEGIRVPDPYYQDPAKAEQRPYFDLRWQTCAEAMNGWEFEFILKIYHGYYPLVEAAHNVLNQSLVRKELEFEQEAARLGMNFTPTQIRRMSDHEMESLRGWFAGLRVLKAPSYHSKNSPTSGPAPPYESGYSPTKPVSPKRRQGRRPASFPSGPRRLNPARKGKQRSTHEDYRRRSD